MASKKKTSRSEHQKEIDRLNRMLADRKKEIDEALGRAKNLEKKKLPTKKEILKQDSEFKKEEGLLMKLMKPQWFLNKQEETKKKKTTPKGKKRTTKKKTSKKKTVKKKVAKKKTVKKKTTKKRPVKKKNLKKRATKKKTVKKKAIRKKR